MVEAEAEHPDWKTLRVVTPAREKRMADSQFLSELMLVVLEKKVRGFDQDDLDAACATYDDIEAPESTVDPDAFLSEFARVRGVLLEVENENQVISMYCRAIATLYSVWSVLALEPDPPPADILAEKLRTFLSAVQDFAKGSYSNDSPFPAAEKFSENLAGASTDFSPRMARHEALVQAIRAPRE